MHPPHSKLGRLVFGCQVGVPFELGSDSYFRGGARGAENAKYASSGQIESLRRGDAPRPQDLDAQQLAIVAKGFNLIESEHPVGAIASLPQLARVHAIRSVEQNDGRSSSPGALQPSTRRHLALRYVEYLCSGHQRRINIERRNCRPPACPSSYQLDHPPLLFERE